MLAIATPLDMISLVTIIITSVCFLSMRRNMRHSSARMAALVFAVAAVALRGAMLAHGAGIHSPGFDQLVAALGTTCNTSLAWVMVVEPPVGRGGLANRLHGILHNAATQLDPDSPADGSPGSEPGAPLKRESETAWHSKQHHP